MPESIQNGGVGKNHWSEKQKKRDAINQANEAAEAAEKKPEEKKEEKKDEKEPATEAGK